MKGSCSATEFTYDNTILLLLSNLTINENTQLLQAHNERMFSKRLYKYASCYTSIIIITKGTLSAIVVVLLVLVVIVIILLA